MLHFLTIMTIVTNLTVLQFLYYIAFELIDFGALIDYVILSYSQLMHHSK